MENQAKDALQRIGDLQEKLKHQLSKPIELPETATKIDYGFRLNDKVGMFRYLHQTNLVHIGHFKSANLVKLAELSDGYLSMISQRNAAGINLFSRSALELTAFLYDVKERLVAITNKDDSDWRAKGEEFFSTIVRARFGTTNPNVLKEIQSDVSKKNLDPINIKKSIAELLNSEHKDIALEYDILCDFVHHNYSSTTISSQGYRHSNTATFGNSIFVTSRDALVISYGYPSGGGVEGCIERTAELFGKCIKTCMDIIGQIPEFTFSKEKILEMTGNEFGMRVETVSNPTMFKLNKNVGRNEKCPCGSGKKFKYCCLQ